MKSRRSPFVEYVEPNYIYKINRTPNDPKLSELWGIDKCKFCWEEGADIDAEKHGTFKLVAKRCRRSD